MPNWVWVGGAALAIIAGIVNAVGFLSFQHQGVTHMTGTTTLLGIAVASHEFNHMLHLLAVMGSFILGAILSGIIIQDSTLRLGRHYGVALSLESLLLFLAVPLLQHNLPIGAYLTSCACGLQNAMASTYSGTTIRTSHVSGYFTDLGISIGHLIRRLPIDRRRLTFCIILSVAFFIGSVLGASLFPTFLYKTLYFPAAITGVFGVFYGIFHHLFISEKTS